MESWRFALAVALITILAVRLGQLEARLDRLEPRIHQLIELLPGPTEAP